MWYILYTQIELGSKHPRTCHLGQEILTGWENADILCFWGSMALWFLSLKPSEAMTLGAGRLCSDCGVAPSSEARRCRVGRSTMWGQLLPWRSPGAAMHSGCMTSFACTPRSLLRLWYFSQPTWVSLGPWLAVCLEWTSASCQASSPPQAVWWSKHPCLGFLKPAFELPLLLSWSDLGFASEMPWDPLVLFLWLFKCSRGSSRFLPSSASCSAAEPYLRNCRFLSPMK